MARVRNVHEMSTDALKETISEKEALRYLLLNWRATLLSMFANTIDDRQLASRAINRCTLILNMLDSYTREEKSVDENNDILGQLALLISEIEHLVETRKDENTSIPEF